MSALAQLLAAGVQVEALPGGKLRTKGNLIDATRALIRSQKPEILAELAAATDAAHYCWRIVMPDGREVESCFLPELTLEEVQARHLRC